MTNTGQDPRQQGEKDIPHASTKIYSLEALELSLEKNEHLRGFVVEARLKWGRLLGEVRTNKQVITRLINLLPVLQTLELLPGHIYYPHARSARVTSLHLGVPKSEPMNIEQLGSLLSNTTLQSLRLSTCQSWAFHPEICDAVVNPQNIAFESRISQLAVSSSICSATVMGVILRASKTLASLHYYYSGKAFPSGNAIMPSNFPTPLASHQSSMKELAIYAQPHQHISYQHPSRDVMESMRGFTALKRLALPAWWMVHPGCDHRERQPASALCMLKLVEMLPPQLEILQVQLEEIRLHCRNQAPFEHLSRKENVIEHFGMLLRWLGEIAVGKQYFVQRLKQVIIWSSGAELPHEGRMLHESGIIEAFREKGVTMRSVICRPDSPILFGIVTES